MSEYKQFCTFYLGDMFLGVEVREVQEVIRPQKMTPVPLASDVIRGLINLRGQIVTAIDLRKRLGITTPPTHSHQMNVIVKTDDGIASLLVDEIGDVIEVRSDDFEAPPETLPSAARDLLLAVVKLKTQLLLTLDTRKTVTNRPPKTQNPDANR